MEFCMANTGFGMSYIMVLDPKEKCTP